MSSERKHERMVIRGRFTPSTFLPWITRHAQRLGLEQVVSRAEPDLIALNVYGPDDLISAMEMGCLLGPIDVWVDKIERIAL